MNTQEQTTIRGTNPICKNIRLDGLGFAGDVEINRIFLACCVDASRLIHDKYAKGIAEIGKIVELVKVLPTGIFFYEPSKHSIYRDVAIVDSGEIIPTERIQFVGIRDSSRLTSYTAIYGYSNGEFFEPKEMRGKNYHDYRELFKKKGLERFL